MKRNLIEYPLLSAEQPCNVLVSYDEKYFYLDGIDVEQVRIPQEPECIAILIELLPKLAEFDPEMMAAIEYAEVGG